MKPIRLLVAGLIATSATLAACGMRNVERVPPQEADTAKPYTSMSEQDLHGRMREMADRATDINKRLRQAVLTDADRVQVVADLAAIEAIARELSADEARTVHPVLWKNIDEFRTDVVNARKQAEATPPNFFLAGTVAGSCAYCHGPDRGKVH